MVVGRQRTVSSPYSWHDCIPDAPSSMVMYAIDPNREVWNARGRWSSEVFMTRRRAGESGTRADSRVALLVQRPGIHYARPGASFYTHAAKPEVDRALVGSQSQPPVHSPCRQTVTIERVASAISARRRSSPPICGTLSASLRTPCRLLRRNVPRLAPSTSARSRR